MFLISALPKLPVVAKKLRETVLALDPRLPVYDLAMPGGPRVDKPRSAFGNEFQAPAVLGKIPSSLFW
jgi:hypothetical protein